jgi:hypothetical protein
VRRVIIWWRLVAISIPASRLLYPLCNKFSTTGPNPTVPYRLMTSANFMGDSIFQETDISPEITVEEAPKFYQEHGIFYASDPEIGRSAGTLGSKALCRDGINMFPVRDPVSLIASPLTVLLTSLSAYKRSLNPSSRTVQLSGLLLARIQGISTFRP